MHLMFADFPFRLIKELFNHARQRQGKSVSALSNSWLDVESVERNTNLHFLNVSVNFHRRNRQYLQKAEHARGRTHEKDKN